jgi:hypothetical protein
MAAADHDHVPRKHVFTLLTAREGVKRAAMFHVKQHHTRYAQMHPPGGNFLVVIRP